MNKRDLVLAIHGTPHKAVVAVTGGGAQVIGELLRYGQGSNTILEAIVPYNQLSFDYFVKGKPDKYCSPEAANDLAMAAYQKAIKFTNIDEANAGHLIGIGVSCSLAKDEEREGRENYAYIAIQTKDVTKTVTLDFTGKTTNDGKKLSRVCQETYVSEFIINMLAIETGVLGDNIEHYQWPAICQDWNIDLKNPIDPEMSSYLDPGLFEILTNQAKVASILPNNSQGEWGFIDANFDGKIIFPGSFNPLHDAHDQIAKKVFELTGKTIDLEICLHNVDKPALNYTSIRKRLGDLIPRLGKEYFGEVHLTALPTFMEKSSVFKNATFVVGWDTFVRISDPKYADIDKVIEAFTKNGTKFIVVHRIINGKSSHLETTENIHPKMLEFATIISHEIHEPSSLSSSEIRKKRS